ncbi:hypothetical protein LMH73_002485 [Vibrio splendidus]|nr:hypothetical protein [Vibrio splendidus]MCC4880450.1 hypothetical protein [Vibrio splendidus]
MPIELVTGLLGFLIGMVVASILELRTKKSFQHETSRILLNSRIIGIKSQIEQCKSLKLACENACEDHNSGLLVENISYLGAYIEQLEFDVSQLTEKLENIY